MILRKYQKEDLVEVCNLFYETINTVCINDYTCKQIAVWSSRKELLLTKNDFFTQLDTIVAVENNQIIGYGNIDKHGYLDHLYIHKDYQRQYIASAICDWLEKGKTVIEVYASITAKPFFEKRGYVTIKKQDVNLDGIALTNYIMEKRK